MLGCRTAAVWTVRARGRDSVNRTLLRHRMLSLASERGVVEKRCLDRFGKVWRFKVVTDGSLSPAAPRALGELENGGFLRAVLNVRLLAPRRVAVTGLGERLLAEWDEKYGPVTA